ncbi:hypothetical protein F5Y16DRAFT_333346 [Xylariaceae sp. FL0255]|nr:hypothetical protein F5Y16DRAFT_333346 [Xylariaceae sp. FL0255]
MYREPSGAHKRRCPSHEAASPFFRPFALSEILQKIRPMARSLRPRPADLARKRRIVRRIIGCHTQTTSNKSLVTRETWPRNAVDWKDERVWEKIRTEGCYHRSDEIIVSCGTVTIDQAVSGCPKILVVYNKNIGIHQLPKGRKDFGEGHLEAAMRETQEETGIAVRPLRLRFGSRSTVPRTRAMAPCAMEDLATGITEGLSTEMMGISEYPDPATGAWRNIHWFAAMPRGDIRRDESRMPLQGDRDKFSTVWLTEEEALQSLKLDDEKFMVRVALAHVRNMSAADWSKSQEFREQEDHRRRV